MTAPHVAGVFPGQGSQAVGMGQALVETEAIARDTFAEADAVLGFSILQLCFDGPIEELKRTTNAQPALVTISTAYWRVLQTRGFACELVAGHSLGEYSALVAAGALTFADALTLVRTRGELMEAASAARPGGMAAVIGMDNEAVEAICAEVAAEHGTLVPANYNAPGQVVVSGENDAIAALRALAKSRGARVIPLPVSGAFHSPLMQSAADAFAAVLAEVTISAPTMPIVQNVTAAATTDPAAIRDALARQITGSVRWAQSLLEMQCRSTSRFVEIGPGNVLTGLVQRTLPTAEAVPVTDVLAQ
jgi:[acyl-carrier-protein] S-malonyltransferase